MHRRYALLLAVFLVVVLGACTNSTEDLGRKLEVAAYDGNLDGVRQALAAGADPNEPSASGGMLGEDPPICVAAAGIQRSASGKDGTAIVKELLEAGAQVDARTPSGWTALIRVANSNNDEVVDLLIEAGADVNAQAEDGKTALMGAAYIGNAQIAERLLEAGADPDLENVNGRTAYSQAKHHDHSAVMELLRPTGRAGNDGAEQ